MRVALVHDALYQYGGGERVLERLTELFPGAPVYTAVYTPELMPPSFRRMTIHTSFIQRLPALGRRRHQAYFPMYPLAFEEFDLSGYDVVISNSGAWARSVITGARTVHVNYCLTPTRWAWRFEDYIAGEKVGGIAGLGLRPLMSYLRVWDVAVSARVDRFVAISETVAERIRKHYRRDADVIFPPVDTSVFRPSDRTDDFYLLVSRLIPYKRIDVVIDAFNRLGLPLLVVGKGRGRAALERRAAPNVQFLGGVSDVDLADLYARCRALICPAEDDFGLVQVEALASGRPVIAYGAGGSLETLIEGETGTFFYEQQPDALIEAIRRLDTMPLDSARIRAHAEQFDVEIFKQRFHALIVEAFERLSATGVRGQISPRIRR